ncbi:hypothetical protein BJV82DRAFT_71487 [Fennellomyces sp. T-0311]|nr:hypothetical protein BJV82DRAFT_71487 [Fennellomyces sp. T-0311]
MLTSPRPTGFPITSPAQQQQQQQQQQVETPKPKKKKTLRQAVGIIVCDHQGRILLLSSRKREGALVLPRGDRNEETQESHDAAAIRILREEAGIHVDKLSRRLGTYTEGNKRGKIVAHHTMYEVRDPKILKAAERERVWVTFDRALAATLDRPMSHLALKNSSFAS